MPLGYDKKLRVEFVKSAARPSEFPRLDVPAVAVAGRSNVGKSSLINCLAGNKNLARISSTPGRTQLINFFSVGGRWFLVDLPGYGFAKVPFEVRQQWDSMLDQFFSSKLDLRLVVLTIDARHEPSELDQEMAQWLHSRGLNCQVVATKFDKLSQSDRARSLARIRQFLGCEEPIPFSATSGVGRMQLWNTILNSV